MTTHEEAADRVRKALAMRDAGYDATPSPEDVARVLHAYDKLAAELKTRRKQEWSPDDHK